MKYNVVIVGVDGESLQKHETNNRDEAKTFLEKHDHEGSSVVLVLTATDEEAYQLLRVQAFKIWVHQYLDNHGVPAHPPGIHGAAGCRIGDRLDWLMNKLKEAERRVSELVCDARKYVFDYMEWHPCQDDKCVFCYPPKEPHGQEKATG